VLDQFIAYAKEYEGVVFATHDEVRNWWLRNYESGEAVAQDGRN
jgi:hypothetical protein